MAARRDLAPRLGASAASAVASLYVPWIFADLAFRVGYPLFIDVAMGTVLIVVLLSAAFGGYALAPLAVWERIVLGVAALPTIAPGMPSTLAGLAVASPILVRQIIAARRPPKRVHG